MKLIDKIKKSFNKKETTEDIMRIAKVVGPYLDEKINAIFTQYHATLLSESVWGNNKDKGLTSDQIEIDNLIISILNEAFCALELKKVDEAQKFAIEYLMRGYIVSKLLYMIEAFKNHSKTETQFSSENVTSLKDIDPLGHA